MLSLRAITQPACSGGFCRRSSSLTALPEGAEAADGVVDGPVLGHHILDKLRKALVVSHVGDDGEEVGQRGACGGRANGQMRESGSAAGEVEVGG